jgi:D-3-phosphoglycerate dehydrogenase
MTVSAYDPFVSPEAVEMGIEFVPDLPTLLSSCDIVSLHAPGGFGAIIGAEQLAMMQPGALLINAGRGELVEISALVDALESGRLAGAAVDVYEPEPPEPESALFRAPNLIATPHMAAMTRESLVRMSTDVAQGVIAALNPN